MTAAATVPAEELAAREDAAAETQRAAFAAWERAYGSWEAAHAEHVNALRRGR